MKKMLVLYLRFMSQLVFISHALYLKAHTLFELHLRSCLCCILIAEHKWLANTLPLQDSVAWQPFHHTSTKQQPHATLVIKLSFEGRSKPETENLTCSRLSN